MTNSREPAAAAAPDSGQEGEVVVIREFNPHGADDAACKALEKAASMTPQSIKWLVDGNMIHKARFDSKIKQFPTGLVLVADAGDASNGPNIVGMVCGAVKDVYATRGEEPKMAKALYIFDLRVSETCRKGGMATRLVRELEERAVALGVTYAYLTVNSDNTKARKLFQKLSFVECSERAPVGGQIVFSDSDRTQDSEPKVEELAGREASDFLAFQLEGVPFALPDFSSIVASPFYHHTFVARKEGSIGAVSLWDGSGLTTFCISRLIFPASYFSWPPFASAMVVVGSLVFGTWLSHIKWLFEEEYPWWGTWWVVCSLLLGIGAKKCSWIGHFVWRMLHNQDGKMKTRARLFGAIADGPEGELLLKAAIVEAKDYAYMLHFRDWICNLSSTSPLRAVFESRAHFRTKLMHKALGRSAGDVTLSDIPALDFHDPRDI